MIKSVAEQLFRGTTGLYSAGYDSTKTMLGQWIQQKSGSGIQNYAGPFPLSVARQVDDATFGAQFPSVIDWGNNLHWVFMVDVTASSAFTRLILYTFNTSNQTWTYKGKIQLTLPSGTHTVRGFSMQKHLYTTGTASTSGTAVTGVNTAWQTARFAAGARIGFGTTDPTAVGTWYYISTITNDTSITLSGSAGTIGSGPFVIEELRPYVVTTCTTATNGGLFVAKGVNFDDFTGGGTTISAAVSTDKVKAVYFLQDNSSTQTNTNGCGIAFSPTKSNTSQMAYVVDGGGGTSMKVYKYDIRAALTVSSGASISAFQLKTGSQTVTGNIAQYNSIVAAITSHGSGNGISSIYAITASTIYRIPETSVMDSSTNYIGDFTIEAPTGTVYAFMNNNVMNQITYCDTLDRFLILPSNSTAKAYLTRYDSSPQNFDRVGLCNTQQTDVASPQAGMALCPTNTTNKFSTCVVNGIMYLTRDATTAGLAQTYAVPLGADWDFAKGYNSNPTYQNRLITPAMATPQCIRYSKCCILYDTTIGQGSSPTQAQAEKYGQPSEPFRVYWRTGGIEDNSGHWNKVNDNWDMSGIGPADNIQFMFEFRVFGSTCIPARVFGVMVTYDKQAEDTHFAASVANSSTSKVFAWRFVTAFGSTVPTLKVYLYNAVTNDLILTDTTATHTAGTFQKSTNDGANGGSWGSYDTTDKSNETTYIRYTPTVLPDNIKIRAVLTQ